MSTTDGVAKLIAFLQAAFPSGHYTPEVIPVWHETLKDFSDHQLLDAAKLLARQHVYGAPGSANVVEAIQGRKVSVPVLSGFLRFPGGPPRIDEHRDCFVPLGQPTPDSWQDAIALGLDQPQNSTKPIQLEHKINFIYGPKPAIH